jgi:hypothetical protein
MELGRSRRTLMMMLLRRRPQDVRNGSLNETVLAVEHCTQGAAWD